MYPRIKNLREDYDYSQTFIAQYLKCSQRTYSDYERGIITWKADYLVLLADLYNVSVDYLLGRTENKEVNMWIIHEW